MPDDALEIEVEVDAAGTATVHVRGEIDLSTRGDFEKALAEAVSSGRPIVVDLGDVPFMDSSGLGALAEALLAVGELTVRRPTTIVRRVLETVVLPGLRIES